MRKRLTTETAGGASLAPDNFAGAVIDPQSGRLVALATDLAKALGCSDAVISRMGSTGRITRRAYRFLDVLEAASHKPGKNPRGRKRKVAGSAKVALLASGGVRAEWLAEQKAREARQ